MSDVAGKIAKQSHTVAVCCNTANRETMRTTNEKKHAYDRTSGRKFKCMGY